MTVRNRIAHTVAEIHKATDFIDAELQMTKKFLAIPMGKDDESADNDLVHLELCKKLLIEYSASLAVIAKQKSSQSASPNVKTPRPDNAGSVSDQVRDIIAGADDKSRKNIMALCDDAGISKGSANNVYHRWKRTHDG